MKFYMNTGCVHKSYLEKILGDQSIAVGVLPDMKMISKSP